MKYIILVAIAVGAIAIGSTGFAGSKIDLPAPDQARAGTMTYEIDRIEFAFNDAYVNVTLVGENGETKTIIYTKAEARAFLDALATGPLKALRFHVLKRLVSDGRLDGVAVQ